jgi:hypothetical protein
MRLSRAQVLIVLVTGCGHVNPLVKAEQAHAVGRFAEAEELLVGVGEKQDKEGAEARRLLALIGEEKHAAALVLMDRAHALAENGAGEQDRLQALAYYRAATELLPPKAKELEADQPKIDELAHWEQALRSEHDTLQARMTTISGTCQPDAQAAGIERLAELRGILSIGESTFTQAMNAAEACYRDGRDLDVITLTEMGLESRLPGEVLSRDAATRFAVAYARLPAVAVAAGEEERTASAVRHYRPRPRTKAEPSSPATPASASPFAASPSAATTANVQQKLARARSEFASGALFEAFQTLDQAILNAESSEAAEPLVKQNVSWQAARSDLIRRYLEQAERALSAEHADEAYDWYKKILVLDFTHEVARDRMKKIEALRRLRSGPGGHS